MKWIDRLWRRVALRLQKELYNIYYVHGPRERLAMGRNNRLANTLFNTRSGSIRIGDDVIFGHNVAVLTGAHDYEQPAGLRRTLEDAGRDIVIEDGAWIASNVTIIGPVRIGAEAVVGAGSVVTRDVEARSIVAGVPAKLVRNLEITSGLAA
ncbi:MAG TPA: acyltransferase [Tepidisphaeraceae bacterium]|jgi:acetyltransferase-like isoleucine patch superfamily enzyme|nr:acyltransferase [Tepidisphaeraceae bacterium]